MTARSPRPPKQRVNLSASGTIPSGQPGQREQALEELQHLVAHIATSLVDNAEAVQVSARRHGPYLTVHLRVAPDELGRVIGKQGRVAKAMRTALGISAAKQGLRANLEIEG